MTKHLKYSETEINIITRKRQDFPHIYCGELLRERWVWWVGNFVLIRKWYMLNYSLVFLKTYQKRSLKDTRRVLISLQERSVFLSKQQVSWRASKWHLLTAGTTIKCPGILHYGRKFIIKTAAITSTQFGFGIFNSRQPDGMTWLFFNARQVLVLLLFLSQESH